MKTVSLINAPKEVQAAVSHVQDSFPNVNRVDYDDECRWTFYNADGTAPDFEGYDIHIDTLEAAADVVYSIEVPVSYC